MKCFVRYIKRNPFCYLQSYLPTCLWNISIQDKRKTLITHTYLMFVNDNEENEIKEKDCENKIKTKNKLIKSAKNPRSFQMISVPPNKNCF